MRASQPRWVHGMGMLLLLAWSTRFVLIYTPTNSLPKGWYMRAFPQRDIAVGDLVVVETPPYLKSLLPASFPHAGLLKQVAAIGGMRVCWTAQAMAVWTADGWTLYAKHPAITRHMPEQCEDLSPAYVVLTGTHAKSLDSRYFGPVLKEYVSFRVWPLWTWGGEP